MRMIWASQTSFKLHKCNKNLCLILTSNNIGVIKWYVDASYAIHDDCHDCTSAMMVFGGGTVTSFSHKQKLKYKSCTEAELIEVDEASPQILWTWYFLEEQGYTITANVLYEDSKSTIIMETKVKTANSKCIRHIKVWYFFINDKITQNGVE